MKKTLIASIMAILLTVLPYQLCAQTTQKRVYDENINPLEQIDQAVARSKSEGKFVICQVGGNWCPWCLRFADFITKDSTISKVIADNFVYIHVNYNPRASLGKEKMEQAERMLQRLNNPSRFGFPVFVVLSFYIRLDDFAQRRIACFIALHDLIAGLIYSYNMIVFV